MKKCKRLYRGGNSLTVSMDKINELAQRGWWMLAVENICKNGCHPFTNLQYRHQTKKGYD